MINFLYLFFFLSLASFAEPSTFLYFFQRCDHEIGPFTDGDSAKEIGALDTYGRDRGPCPAPFIELDDEWPTIDAPRQVWGCGSLNVYPQMRDGVISFNKIHLTVRYYRNVDGRCETYSDGLMIHAYNTKFFDSAIREDDKEKLRLILRNYYGAQTMTWTINDGVFTVYKDFLTRVKDQCSAIKYIPQPIASMPTSIISMASLLARYVHQIYDAEEAERAHSTYNYACVKAASLAFKTEFYLASQE